ncbi:MAG: PHB depolymerase family esterase [Pseudomonadota bacterium]|nr:PHB depolymerase family esterase [Pseudomonadota bacterium]
MNSRLPADMLEATRLTRAGRLLDATAAIQRALRGETGQPAPDGAATHARAGQSPLTLEGVAERVDELPDWMARLRNITGSGPQGLGALGSLPLALDGLMTPGLSTPLPIPEGARFIKASYTNHAGSRDYKLYVPSGYRGEALPLVVMLHGCTQNPDDFAAGTRMNELAERHGCLVAYPAQAGTANPSRCWNWFNAADQRRDQGEPSLIAGITRQVMADYAVDPNRVYVAGLSAGGAMAAVMAATYPDLYAAVGIHSGLAHGSAHDMPSAFAAMGQAGAAAGAGGADVRTPVPTIVFHGDRDATVHPDNGERIVGQWRAAVAGTGTQWRTEVEKGSTPGGHGHTRTRHIDAAGRAILEQWRIHGAGHAWAGGSPSGSYTDPRGPDASAEMLRFFLSHARCGC